MYPVRLSLMLFVCVSALFCDAQMPGAAAAPQARHAALSETSVQLVQIGTRFYSDGPRVPIWAVMLGDTAEAERIAHVYRGLGPYGLNATLWTHTDGVSGWVRTSYRRPRNIGELLAWHDDVGLFTLRQEGDDSLLPAPLASLQAELVGKLDFIIRYDDGSTKVYLYPGTSKGDAERVVTALTGRD